MTKDFYDKTMSLYKDGGVPEKIIAEIFICKVFDDVPGFDGYISGNAISRAAEAITKFYNEKDAEVEK